MNKVVTNSSSNAVYGMGFIGALIYYLSHADSFWTGLIGIIKSIFWPGFLVYEALSRWGL